MAKKNEPKKENMKSEKIIVKKDEKKDQKDQKENKKKEVEKKDTINVIKIAHKKPGLQIAPSVMVLGKNNQKNDEKKVETNKKNLQKITKKEINDIKVELLQRREKLVNLMKKELASQRERMINKVADEVDKAADAYDEDLSFEIAVANDQELKEIEIALERIESGSYGECELCGCTISPSRLKILPSATTCVGCRGQEEQQKKRDDPNLLFNLIDDENDLEVTEV